ncbi:MAG: Alpha-glucosidase [Gammaproteobacteria bacterium]|nr:Alpha-glucosidase [Gammaproteobacteria bacterium]
MNALVFLVLAASVAAAQSAATIGPQQGASPAITLDIAGGDTWRFDKQIYGKIKNGACDAVTVRTPTGDVRALLQKRQFMAEVRLRSGMNEVRAQCWRTGVGVARSAVQRWIVRRQDVPRAWIRTRVSGMSVRMDAGATELAHGTPAPIASYEWRPRAGNPAPLVLAHGKRIEIDAPGVDGEYNVTLHVTDSLGRADESTAVFRVSGGKPLEVDTEREHPDWLDGVVIYGVAPALFTPVGFAGVERRLDAIAALGAGAIWLSPVTQAPTGDFGYAVMNHFQLRGLFGSEEQFRHLIAAAHGRGLKVLLDFVPNHLSDRHPYYLDAQRRGSKSAYYDWFERDATGKVVHYFDWTQLETLNYDNPEVRDYITASFVHWVRDYHVDGFRVDASWAVRERAPEYWPRLHRELKRIDPELVLVAEASARDPYYATHGFDAAYDWTSNLGEWAWQAAFADAGTTPDLQRLREALTNAGSGFPDDIRVLHFLDNNDTGARFLTRHGIEQTRSAAVLLLTLPGLPLIYNGDETGAAFEPYQGPAPLEWRDRYALTPFYSRLAKLRRETPALRSGDLRIVATDHDDSVLAYARCTERKDDGAVVVINFGNTPVETRLAQSQTALCGAPAMGSGACAAEDLLTGRLLETDPDVPALPLAAHGALLLRHRQERAAVSCRLGQSD